MEHRLPPVYEGLSSGRQISFVSAARSPVDLDMFYEAEFGSQVACNALVNVDLLSRLLLTKMHVGIVQASLARIHIAETCE